MTNDELAAVATERLALLAAPKTPLIAYGVVREDGGYIDLENHACHHELTYTNDTKRGVYAWLTAAVLIYTRQICDVTRPAEVAYVTWLAGEQSPWRTLRKTLTPDGWLIPTDQPANLIYNFCIATRTFSDPQVRWNIKMWHQLVLAGIHPSLAYSMVASLPIGDTTFAFSNTYLSHMPVEAFYPGNVDLFVAGTPKALSKPYANGGYVTCKPTSMIWGYRGGNAPYTSHLQQQYTTLGSIITGKTAGVQRTFGGGEVYFHPNEHLIPLGKIEAIRLGVA